MASSTKPRPNPRFFLFTEIVVGLTVVLALTLVVLYLSHQASLSRSLVAAVAQGRVDEAKELLDRGADVDSSEQTGQGPSVWDEIIGALRGKTIRKDPRGPTCLLLALREYEFFAGNWCTSGGATNYNPQMVRLLLEHGAKRDAQGPVFQEPFFGADEGAEGERPVQEYPLLVACEDHDWASAKLLIDYGANVNAVGYRNETPLLLAVNSYEYGTAIALLKHGADPNAQNTDECWTPIMSAICNQETELVKALIQYGANVNFKSPKRPEDTPLSWAKPYPEILKLLVKAGAK